MVTPSLQELIAVLIQAHLPALMWGEPGTGKTSFARSLAKALGAHIETLIASIREPSEIGGLPVIRENGVVLETPAWAKRLIAAQTGILFLDEITTAPPSVQAALLRVVLEGVVGETPLPAGIMILSGANPPEQAAGGWSLSPPMANRFVHLRWGVKSAAWVRGMTSDWPVPNVKRLPSNWRETHLIHARAMVAAFINHRPMLLQQFPKEESARGGAWPSCRTWDYAATALGACNAVGYEWIEAIEGCVGPGAATEFSTWMKALDLPDPEKMLANPADFEVMERQDRLYASVSAITAAFQANPSVGRWNALWRIYGKVIEAKKPDVVVVPAKSVVKWHADEHYPLPKEAGSLLPLFDAAKIRIKKEGAEDD